MKKLLSFILALALVISLVPTIAIASAQTDKITLNFNNTTLAASNTTTDAANFEIVIDKTGHAPKDLQTKQARVEAYLDSKATTNWYSVYKAGTKGRFTVKTKIPAGNYKVSYVGGNASTGAVAAIYVGNEFVTMDDCYADKAYPDNFVEDRGTIGYVSVTPDEDGYVEITFLTAAVRVVNSFSLMLSSITFEKVDAIPEMSTEVKVGENVVADKESIELPADSEIDLSARLKYSDGTYRDLLGYTPSFEAGSATLSEDAENAFSVTVEGDSVSYEKTSSLTSESIADTMGVYTGKLTAVKPGTSTVTVTGTVNGDPVSQTFSVTVPGPITLNFNNTTLTAASSGGAAAATESATANFEVVDSQTTNTKLEVFDKQVRVSGYMDTGYTLNWYANYLNTNNRGRFTVKTQIPAGNYKVNYAGGNAFPGGIVALYINSEFVGMDDSYIEGVAYASNKIDDKKTIGYVSVAQDEEYTEITFLLAAIRAPGGTDLMLSSIEFERVDAIPEMSTEVMVGEKIISSGNEFEVSQGADISLSARLKYTDGIYRDLTGHAIDFANKTLTADPQNAFTVSIQGNSVEYQETRNFSNSASVQETMGIYTGKLTAVKPGTSTITVTGKVNGAPKSQSFTVTVPYVYTDTGAETVNNKISYIVRADERANDSKVKVSDNTYTVNGTNVGEWTVGESFTATATGDDFAYWANGNGTPVSESASYTFTPTSNFTLEAVYAPADTTTKKVQFWNYNKVYLGDKGVSGDKVESMPANPSLNGYTFKEWVADGIGVFNENTTIEDAITRVVAQFTKNAAAFSVGGETKAYDDTFTKTAADTAGENAFSYWTIDGQVASYEKTLSFNVWDAVDVVPVYEGEKTAVPTVVLEKVDHTNSPDEYFILYEVPAGFTAVDAGIVFGTAETTPRVDSTDGSKASVKQAGAKGQFTAAPGDDSHTAARGYVMYRIDATGELRVLYTPVK